jgi:hypothetical protein
LSNRTLRTISIGVDALLTKLDAPLLSQPAAHCTRQRRTSDMMKVRRSARLGKKPVIPAVERAQRNLCRKVGHSADELIPIEEVLCDFIAMFHGPLPIQIVDVMAVIFNLDDDDSDLLDEALLRHAGTAVADLDPPTSP